MSEPSADHLQTRASIFLKLKASDPQPRELAWSEFRDRYAPVIAGFARKIGARPHEVDELVQDVLIGFFSISPQFVYDPSKGRFRGYLKTATLNAVRNRIRNRSRDAKPLSDIADDAETLEQSWERSWREQILRRAIHAVRKDYEAHPTTFRAFELYVLRDMPPADVARELGIHIDSVYQAKHRVSEALRVKTRELDDDES